MTQAQTTTTTTQITHEDADAIVQASAYADLVEESETTEAGYVYTLSDGSAVVVGFDGTLVAPEHVEVVQFTRLTDADLLTFDQWFVAEAAAVNGREETVACGGCTRLFHEDGSDGDFGPHGMCDTCEERYYPEDYYSHENED